MSSLAVTSNATFVSKVYNHLDGGILSTAGMAYFLSVSGMAPVAGSFIWWVALLSPLAFVLMLGAVRSDPGVTLLYYALCAAHGITLVTLLERFPAAMVVQAGLMTTVICVGASVYGWITKRDLSGMERFLVMALLGLIVAMVMMIFFHSSVMSIVISLIAIVVFAGFMAMDTQAVRDGDGGNEDAVCAALSLYLNVYNIFLHLLSLLKEFDPTGTLDTIADIFGTNSDD